MISEGFGLFSPDTSPHWQSRLRWPHRFLDLKLHTKKKLGVEPQRNTRNSNRKEDQETPSFN